MTVGTHKPKNLPAGARPARCSICGVLWYSNRLTRKADGQLYCPDDVRGEDSVTLSEANARDAVTAGTRLSLEENQGASDTSTDAFRSAPSGILGTNLSGWWGYQNLQLGGGVHTAFNFDQVNRKDPAHATQPDVALRPSFDGDNDITFDGSDDYLLGGSRPLVELGAFPRIYVVGSFDDPTSATADSVFALSDAGLSMGYTAAVVNKVYLQAQSGVMTLGFTVNVGGFLSHQTLTRSFTSTALHLWTIELTATSLTLYEDGVEVATKTLVSAASRAFSYVFMGAGVAGTTKGDPTTISSHDGRCNEIILSKTTVSAADDTLIKQYVGRNFTELTIA